MFGRRPSQRVLEGAIRFSPAKSVPVQASHRSRKLDPVETPLGAHCLFRDMGTVRFAVYSIPRATRRARSAAICAPPDPRISGHSPW